MLRRLPARAFRRFQRNPRLANQDRRWAIEEFKATLFALPKRSYRAVESFSMDDATYGRLCFQDLGKFEASSALSLVEEALEVLRAEAKRPIKAPPIVDWPRITECIRRGSMFALMAEAPSLRASLRFDPAAPDEGDYEIHASREQRHETGRVLSVLPLEEEAIYYQHKYAMLAQFPTRYLLITSAADRQGTQQVWLIGIQRWREVRPEEIEQAGEREGA